MPRACPEHGIELTFIGFLIFQTGLHCHSLINYKLNNNFKLAGPDRMLMGQTIMVINNQGNENPSCPIACKRYKSA